MPRAVISISLTSLLALAISGCGRGQDHGSAEAFGIPASGARSRCASLPLDQASDPACKREGDENLKKFLGRGGGS